MSRKINSLARKISRILNFVPNTLTNDITVTIYSDYQAVISGYKRILVYDDNLLVVSDGEKNLKIMGSNLVLRDLLQDELILTGHIKAAEFEYKGGKT